jgi:5'-3' exonuclease
MGVPSYFGWIMKQVKKFGLFDMVHSRLKGSTKRLYLDFNCLIHRACRECKDGSEDDMIARVISTLKEVIDHVKPSDLVYISIDGSVPMGKCKQQRFRRFKSVKEAHEIDQIRQKYGQKPEQSKFDFNAISPGTSFMNKLATAIGSKIEQWKLLEPNLQFILSTSHEPGEGEHKIMKHIKTNRPETDQQIVIYGLDADLIFLSLGLHHSATYLFRENTFHENIAGEVSDYLYLNIGDLRENVIRLIVQADDIIQLPTNIGRFFLKEIVDYDSTCLINDYIFFNFFLGNDFVNRLYCLSIRNRGCEIMLQIYRYCLRQCKGHLVNCQNGQISVNNHFLHHFLECIAEYEEHWWKDPPKYYPPPIESGLSAMEQEIEEYGRIDRYLHNLQVTLHDRWFKSKYYHRLFNLSQHYSLEENISYICRKYWSTVKWTLEYYLSDCPDWEWYYPFEYAPLMDDLIHHFRTINNSPFKNNAPIDVTHQLMIILPPKSFHLLPGIYRRILHNRQFAHYFPSNFDYLCYGHRFAWECSPNIPILDSKMTRSYYEYLHRHAGENQLITQGIPAG